MDAFIEQLRSEARKKMDDEGRWHIDDESIDSRMEELAVQLHKLLTENGK